MMPEYRIKSNGHLNREHFPTACSRGLSTICACFDIQCGGFGPGRVEIVARDGHRSLLRIENQDKCKDVFFICFLSVVGVDAAMHRG